MEQHLQEFGWAVVPEVLTDEECNQYIEEFREWLGKFGDKIPISFGSIIDEYNLGHKNTTWNIRLKTKSVFSKLWGTDKLLSSIDGVSIGYPPEEYPEMYELRGCAANTLHLDQGAPRVDLHAYQGAVYLEEALEDDWNFSVIESSHKYHTEFFEQREPPAREFLPMRPCDIKFYKERGCEIKDITCPKGGMILWDSRLVHAGSPPRENRANPGRWRFVVFVCMGPAWWAKESDMEKREDAYNSMRLSVHWPTEGFKMFPKPVHTQYDVEELPEIAKTDEVKLLCGAKRYNFNDGQPNGPKWRPKWA